MRLPAASALLEGAGDLVALAAGERIGDDTADQQRDDHRHRPFMPSTMQIASAAANSTSRIPR